MPPAVISFFKHLIPPANTAAPTEQLRAAACALAALGLTAWLSVVLLGSAGMWLVASMGASAVLLFCVPAGPMSQPWAVMGGNIVSALVGVACVKLVGTGLWTAPLAGALAIAAMFALRCLRMRSVPASCCCRWPSTRR